MGPPNESHRSDAQGFEGSVAGLGLADVIELSANNRFSGCVSVRHDQSTGLIFFREGEVIHAEHEGVRGEEAFYAIMQWPGGKFSVEPNVATTSRTIERNWKFLLMEAHRVMDERRSGRPPSPEQAPATMAAPASDAAAQRVRQIAGVAYAVSLAKDGGRLGDDSYEAETLQGQTAYLAMLGKRLGEIFHLGDVEAASVQGSLQHLLLLASGTHDLSVLVKSDSQPGAVEAEIRKLMAARRSRE